ncbi:MAG: aminoglycoside phosphotransferase family protein [Oscillospiraceae bacterium]|nr:aminoglycoside phosphotransferase family protein [Blautia sp.]MBR3001850.1 aminoglycoside phosphotransferase family protein [Oscillospiraceae bacterium]
MANREIIEEKSYKTVYREGNVIVKEFTPSHPKSDVFNEAYIHTCVEEAGVPVPRIISVEPANGGWALSMEYVPGKTLEQLMKENPDKCGEYIEKLVEIQLEVAQHRVPKLRNTRYKLEDVINGMTEIDASTRYELLQRIHGMKRHTRLCHGDFVPSNVLLREDGSYCILDWAHASSGNAGADAAITYLRFCLDDPQLADTYLKCYCQKADMAIQYVQTWMPIVAAAQLAKHKENERELLEKWISVAEYQ